MGNFDTKNIIVKIEVRDNLTDPRYVEFIKGWDFTYEEFDKFCKETKNLYTEMAHRMVSFITDYKDGLLLPDRCGTYEPLKHDFKKEEIMKYVNWISFPAGYICLKKRRKFEIEIKNNDHAISWISEPRKPMELCIPVRSKPEYMGEIKFYFAKQRKIDMDFLEQLLMDYCEYLQADTDRAYIYDMEDQRILFDIFHPENVGKNRRNTYKSV